MENEVQTKEKSLAFWLVLLAALVIGVVLVFALLKMAIPPMERPMEETGTEIVETIEDTQDGESSLPAPNFCPHCGDDLPDSFQWGQYCPFCGENVEG